MARRKAFCFNMRLRSLMVIRANSGGSKRSAFPARRFSKVDDMRHRARRDQPQVSDFPETD